MFYLVKCFLKVQIDKIYHFIIVRVIRVYDLGIKIEQACQAATFVSEAMLRVTIRLFISKCVISLPLTNLSNGLADYRSKTNGSVVSRFLRASFLVNCSHVC